MVNWIAVAAIGASAVVTVAAAYTLREVRRLLRGLRVEAATFEEDHGRLVQLYLEMRRRSGEV